MNYMHVDESVLKSIREVIDDVPMCETCGGDADECGCAALGEDDEVELKEPSGDKEDIVINPEIDAFSAAKQQKVDEWTSAAKLKEAPQHYWVGKREFADKGAADHYAKAIGGVVTPQANPDHKGFKALEPKKPLSKDEKDAKWNERMPWPKDYVRGQTKNTSAIHQPHGYTADSHQPKGNRLTEGIDADEHFKKYAHEYADVKFFTTAQWAAALGKKDRSHGYKGMYAYKTKKGKWYHELVRTNGELDTDTKWALTPLQVKKLGLHESYGNLTEGIRAFKSGSDPELKNYLEKHVIRSKWRKSAEARRHADMFDGATVIRVGEGETAYYLMVQPKDTGKNHENNPHHDTLIKHGFKHTGSEKKGMGNLDFTDHHYEHPKHGTLTVTHGGEGYNWKHDGKWGGTDKALKSHLSSRS